MGPVGEASWAYDSSMAARSKWLDPVRMARGIHWRWQAWRMRNRIAPRPAPIVGTSFRDAVLRSFGVTDVTQLEGKERMWAEFRLSAVERGQAAVSLLGGPVAIRGKRVLDVGCAYAGFLIAARQAGAREMVGVDIDPELLASAGLLLSDHSVSARLEIADLTDPHLPDLLGTFDIVFCNDVLEHVLDLEQAATNLEQLLTVRGRLFLEIPNGQAARYLQSDGHYRLPGITLLDHADAERWFRATHHDQYPYRTYFYAPLDYYVSLFSRAGLHLRLLNPPVAGESITEALATRWDEAIATLRTLTPTPEQPADLVASIRQRAEETDLRFRRLLQTARSSPIPEERAVAQTTLLTEHGLDSFLLEGRKPA
jgi:2-polyprenyl-3-methyl-5-hydroxy-6-metoxy-1,4-benzoquinol methylase